MMTVNHSVYCTRCGEVYEATMKHTCPYRYPYNDTPFATVVELGLPMLDEVTGRIVTKFRAELAGVLGDDAQVGQGQPGDVQGGWTHAARL